MEQGGRREESEVDVIMEEGLDGCQFLALKLQEGGHEPRPVTLEVGSQEPQRTEICQQHR